MNAPRRFANSFRPRYDELMPDESCNLQHHYRGALRELIGWLDLLANNRPDRFVFCGPESMIAHCHYFEEPENKYSRRQIFYALKEFRARHIISKRLVRLVDGVEREGFIVAPHDCLCLRESETDCVLVGYMNANARWSREIIVKDQSGKPLAEPRIGPIYWAGYSSMTPCALESALPCALPCAPRCALSNSGQANDLTKVNPNISRLTEIAVVTESVVGTERNKNNTKPSQNQSENQNLLLPSSSSPRLTDQKQTTIGQHFPNGCADMEEITCGEWEERQEGVSDDQREEDEINNGELIDICNAIIRERIAEKYQGRKTHGDIMAEAMVRYTKQYNENVPQYWYPIIKELRKPRPTPDYEIETERRALFTKLLAVQDLDWNSPDGKSALEWIETNVPEMLSEKQAKTLLMGPPNPKPIFIVRLWALLHDRSYR